MYQKVFGRIVKDDWKLLLTVFVLSILVSLISFFSYADNINKILSDRLVRLHIIANSDLEKDQKIKLKVRDGILSYMEEHAGEFKKKSDVENFIQGNLKEFKEIAHQIIIKEGENYKVALQYTKTKFPTKYYGNIALPAGIYDSLCVKIGKADGHNWWCVMFPPLCFVDATHGKIPEKYKEELKKTLPDEEYDLITGIDDSGNISVKVKFKIVELFQNSRIRIVGLFNKLIR